MGRLKEALILLSLIMVAVPVITFIMNGNRVHIFPAWIEILIGIVGVCLLIWSTFKLKD